jgi:hypothetical protein
MTLATELLSFRHSIKHIHWSTDSYAIHKATDGYLIKLDGLIDRIIETYSARYGKPMASKALSPAASKAASVKAVDVKIIMYPSFSIALELFAKQFLQTDFERYINKSLDTDLVNLRDELLSETMTALYLSSFS